MATYQGSNGLKRLREKIDLKGKLLVGQVAEKLATHLTDESPLGSDFYRSSQGLIGNDVGDFKNSWSVGLGTINQTTRPADTTGSGSIAEAIVQGSRYNFEEKVYVTNSKDYAVNVENGWEDNPTYGWSAKDGYHIVANSKDVAEALLISVANKVSKM